MTTGRHDTTYMKKLTGSRLKAARGKTSRQKLVDTLNKREDRPVIGDEKATLSLETLKKWEYGENPINIEWLPAICAVLGCDTGFLFGAYEEYTIDRQQIRDKTKLSKKAVDWLLKNKSENPHLVQTLNELFEYDGIADALFSSIFNFAMSHYSNVIVSDTIRHTERRMDLAESKQILKFSVQECFSDVLDCLWDKNQPVTRALAIMQINKLKKEIAEQEKKSETIIKGETDNGKEK